MTAMDTIIYKQNDVSYSGKDCTFVRNTLPIVVYWRGNQLTRNRYFVCCLERKVQHNCGQSLPPAS